MTSPGLPASNLQSGAFKLFTVLQNLLHPGPRYFTIRIRGPDLNRLFFIEGSLLLEGKKELVCVRTSKYIFDD